MNNSEAHENNAEFNVETIFVMEFGVHLQWARERTDLVILKS